jgi:hypothetical protein
MIPPILFLAAVVVATAVAAAVATSARKARSHKLAKLAAEWSMKFAEDDRFVLGPRVAAALPVPGAADVLVRDLVYAQEPTAGYRYFFTVEYTTGVLRTKRRRVAAGTIVESPHVQHGAAHYTSVLLAPVEMPLIEQYAWLRMQGSTEGQSKRVGSEVTRAAQSKSEC